MSERALTSLSAQFPGLQKGSEAIIKTLLSHVHSGHEQWRLQAHVVYIHLLHFSGHAAQLKLLQAIRSSATPFNIG